MTGWPFQSTGWPSGHPVNMLGEALSSTHVCKHPDMAVLQWFGIDSQLLSKMSKFTSHDLSYFQTEDARFQEYLRDRLLNSFTGDCDTLKLASRGLQEVIKKKQVNVYDWTQQLHGARDELTARIRPKEENLTGEYEQ